jgi:hypothetical protein
MNKERHFLKIAGCIIVILVICGCAGKKPEDDVALIKQLLAKLERGVSQKNETVLDSVMQDEKGNLSTRLLDSLYQQENLEGARITSKSFVIVGDSAEVSLTLSFKFATDKEEVEQVEKPLQLFLNKKKGKWRMQDFKMISEKNQ